MFGLAWTEIGLIGVVAMVLIGPKDLPIAIRAISDLMKKARRMAGEFQGHVDSMVREADSTGAMSEFRQTVNQIRRFDIKTELTKAVDADGAIRATLSENPVPLTDWGGNPTIHVGAAPLAPETGHVDIAPVAPIAASDAPAFIPPASTPPGLREAAPPPAFIPPAAI